MLLQLRIENFALIKELDLRLEPGLNVLTGETGAGKSILIDAIGLVLGRRASPADVRSGAPSAYVEGVFAGEAAGSTASLLHEFGIEPDDTLVLTREVASEGRSVARVHGRAVPLRALAELGRRLVDVHGQSEHQSLFLSARQLEYLDRFGGLEPARDSVSALVGRLRAARAEIQNLQRDAREMAREIDLLRFQSDEIGEAAPEPGEDERLDAERRVLANAERLRELAARAAGVLDRDQPPGALDLLGEAQAALDEASELDPGAAGMRTQLAEAQALVAELARSLEGYAHAVEADPSRLADLNARIDILDGLKRKYGDSLDDVLAFAVDARQRLTRLESNDDRLRQLAEDTGRLEETLAGQASKLSKRRARAGGRLARAVVAELEDLRLPGAAFTVRLETHADPDGLALPDQPERVGFDVSGIDRGEFMLSVNAGQSPRSLAQVASGGETSRILLGLKSVLAAVDDTPTLIFDEIDVGVGGRSGDVVGQKLSGLAQNHQVLCITHLPTVAAFADAHFMVEKASADKDTVSRVRRLARDEIIAELAAMGGTDGPAARRVARDMLARAVAWKAAAAHAEARSA